MRDGRPRSLVVGLRSLSQGRLVLLLTVTTIALALPAAFALRPSFREVFAGTLAGDHILRNHPEFAPTDVLEFLYEKRLAVAGACQAAMAAGVVGLFLQVFFAGGFVETLARGRRVSLGEFLAGSARNFWHNLKCFVIFLPAVLLVLAAWVGGMAALGRRLFEETPPGSASSLLFRLAIAVVAFLVFAFFSLLHDFARLSRRGDRTIGAWRGWGLGGRLLFRSLFTALGLFFFWVVAGGALWLGVIAVEWLTPAVSVAAILLHTGLQIAAVLIRSAVRLGAWGSYAAFVDARRESPALTQKIVTEEMPEPLLTEPISPIDTLGDKTLT